MNKKQLDNLLIQLNAKLESENESATMYVYGGYALAVHGLRDSTQGIDALFEPKQLINRLASEIAQENHIPAHWLNDAIKVFIDGEHKI